MVQGPGSEGTFCWNDKDFVGGYSASDGFLENSLSGFLEGQEDCVDAFDDGSGFDSKRIKLMAPNNQIGSILTSFKDSEPPLGLTLRKTPSFLDLIEKLSQRKNIVAGQTETNPTVNAEKAISRRNEDQTEKLKASNFPATFLRIGTWERKCIYEGDLVAKCYYAKHKVVWEVLDRGLKSKIEVQWSDISAIRAIFQENNPGILDIELSHPPQYFREINPQPRKHTLWQSTSDFTGGQADTNRRHHLRFPEGTLEKHYENLLQCDNRLFILSQRPFPMLNSPYFPSNLYGYQDFSFRFNGYRPEFPPVMHYPHLNIPRDTLVSSHHGQNFRRIIRPSIGAMDSASPMSVMEFPPIEENGSNPRFKHQMTSYWGQGINNDQSIHTRQRDQVQGQPVIDSTTQVNYVLPQQGSYNLLTSGNGSEMTLPNDRLLDEISKRLLDDSHASVYPDEQRVMAKVRSISSLIEASTEQNPMSTGEKYAGYGHPGSMDDHLVSRSSAIANGDGGLLCPEPLSWLSAQGPGDNTLMNLPRIPSFTYFGMDQQVNPSAFVELSDGENEWR